jgi:hypothetical protein
VIGAPLTAPPGGIFLEAFARPLLLLHAVAGFTTVGATTHHAVYAWLAVGGPRRSAQLRRFGWIAPAALLSQILLGLVLYPTYRVRVRAAHLDRELPLVVQLFDFKEHLAALAVVLVLGAAFAGRRLGAPPAVADVASRPLTQATAALSVTGAALVWVTALIGLYVTSVHPVGLP